MARSERQARTWAVALVLALWGALVAMGGSAPPAAANTGPPVWSQSFGTAQLTAAQGVAVAPGTGVIYVVDSSANKVVRFDSSGAFLSQWGSTGSGNLQFNNPHGVAVGPDGSVYVADTNNNRIVKFTATGTYVAQWGTNGTLNGQMTHPYGVAVDSAGNVFVADTDNHRIQKFTSTGTYKTKWGARGTAAGRFSSPQGVAVSADRKVYVLDNGNNRVQQFTGTGSYQRLWGGPGSGDGQLSTVGTSTGSLAVDTSGNVWVADGGNHRVQEFTGTGTFVTWFGGPGTGNNLFDHAFGVAMAPNGTDVLVTDGANRVQRFRPGVANPGLPLVFLTKWGTLGAVDGELNSPSGVAVDGSGNVYVADTANHRVHKFTSTGTFVRRWGTNGSGDGQFSNPRGVAVDGSGNVYVADTGNNRVQEFTSGGQFLAKWGSNGSGEGQFFSPRGVGVDTSGNVYVADTLNQRVQKFTSAGQFLTKWGSSGSGDGQFAEPRGVAVDESGNVYVADSLNHRIQKFGSAGAPPPVFVNAWGSAGSGNGQFGFPYQVATDAAGNVYVTDFANSRVEKFGSTGTYLTQWSGSLSGPIGVAVGPDASVYVVDYNTSEVARWTPMGDPDGQWGGSGAGNGQFSGPFSVAVAADGTVYVTDPGNNRVQYFTAAGAYLGQWGGTGSGNGQFDSPLGVAVGPDGSVYVTDEHNNRVQRFTATGSYVGQWGTAGSGEGQFNHPFAVAVDGAGYVYVTDFFNNRVQQFTANGTYRSLWGTAGSGNAQFNGPTGVAVGASGYVYVVDANNSRVQRFAPPAQPTVSLSVDQTQVSPGDGIDYHLTITNATANTLTGMRVTDAHVPDCAGPVDNLAAGATTTVECTYQTTADDVGPFTNTASVDTDQTDTFTSNTVSTQVGPAVTVSMTAPARVTATASIQYAIGITNNTALSLTGVRVSDTAVPGCAGPVADIASGATATVNCTKTTTDADSGSSVFNAAFVDAPGTQGGFATAVTSVRGRITGTITGPNGPVAGAFVLALSRDLLPLQGDTVANASGVYNLGLDPGRYYLAFLDPSGATQAEYYNNKTSALALTSADLVTVNVGSGPATANAVLAAGFLPVANPATISGTVTDANGPVAGVWVVAVNGGVRSATRTNAAGQYTVGNLPAGNAYLEFADPPGTHAFRWYLNNDGTNPTAIPVTAGQQVTGINQVLPPYP